MNHIEQSSENASITENRDIPWLQDEADIDFWSSWSVSYRDVYIVHSDSTFYRKYNLSSFDLNINENKEELKTLLRNLSGGTIAP